VSLNIFNYTDYRKFLKDFYEDEKKRSDKFSYRFFSKQCGYSSPNFLKLVIDGKRNLSIESIHKFSQFFKFNKDEKEYFLNLIHFNQASNTSDKETWAKNILQQSLFKRSHPLSREKFEYYAHWYYVAIRELYGISNIRLTPEIIATKLTPKVDISEVKKAIKVLIDLKLIKKINNYYKQTNEIITTGNEVSSVAVALHHKQMMELAFQSIETCDRSRRDISGVTVSIGEDRIKDLKILIQNFRKSILELSESDQKKEHVYQVSIQMFPLTKYEIEENQ